MAEGMTLFPLESQLSLFTKAKIKTESEKAILIRLLDFRSRPKAVVLDVSTKSGIDHL